MDNRRSEVLDNRSFAYKYLQNSLPSKPLSLSWCQNNRKLKERVIWVIWLDPAGQKRSTCLYQINSTNYQLFTPAIIYWNRTYFFSYVIVLINLVLNLNTKQKYHIYIYIISIWNPFNDVLYKVKIVLKTQHSIPVFRCFKLNKESKRVLLLLHPHPLKIK